MEETSIPLQYAAPATLRRRFPLPLAAFALLVLAFLHLLFFLTEKLKRPFEDFHLKLPLLTQSLLDVGNLFSGYGWAVAWGGAALMCFAVAAVKRPEIEDSRDRLIAWLKALCALLTLYFILIVLFVIAWLLPVITLIDGMSGGGNS